MIYYVNQKNNLANSSFLPGFNSEGIYISNLQKGGKNERI